MLGKGKDYYQILGVDPKATQEQIEKAYKVKFAEWGMHPENAKNPEAVKKFEELREAYMTLRNSDRRATYNRTYRKQMDVQEAQNVFESFFHANGIEGEMEKEFFKQHFPNVKESPYEVLGLPSTASIEEVQKAYRSLVLKTHPAGNKHDPEIEQKFIKVTQAYKDLMEQDKQAKLEEKKEEHAKDVDEKAKQVLDLLVKKISKVIEKAGSKVEIESDDVEKVTSPQEKSFKKNVRRTSKKVAYSSSEQSSDLDRDRRYSTSSVSSRNRSESISNEDYVDRRYATNYDSTRKVRGTRNTDRYRRYSTSSESSEDRFYDRRRRTGDRKATREVSRRDRRAYRDRQYSTSSESSEDQKNYGPKNYRREQQRGKLYSKARNTRKDRRDSTSEYTSERTSSYSREQSRDQYQDRRGGKYCPKKQDSRRYRECPKRTCDRRGHRDRRDSTSSVSSEEYARGRKRVTWNRKEVCPSRRDQRTKCDRKKARRDRRDSSSEYTSEDSSRDYRRRQRKPRKDRRDSSSEYTSEGTSSGTSSGTSEGTSSSYSSDSYSYSRSRSYNKRGGRDNRRQDRGYKREDYRREGERRRMGGQRRNDGSEDYNRSRSGSRIEKKYTSGNKWHADYAEKGYYDVARENEPREVVSRHLKEGGPNTSAVPQQNSETAPKPAASQTKLEHSEKEKQAGDKLESSTPSHTQSQAAIAVKEKQSGEPEKLQGTPIQPPESSPSKAEEGSATEKRKYVKTKGQSKKKQEDEEKPELLKPKEE